MFCYHHWASFTGWTQWVRGIRGLDLGEGVQVGRCCWTDHSVGKWHSFEPDAAANSGVIGAFHFQVIKIRRCCYTGGHLGRFECTCGDDRWQLPETYSVIILMLNICMTDKRRKCGHQSSNKWLEDFVGNKTAEVKGTSEQQTGIWSRSRSNCAMV